MRRAIEHLRKAGTDEADGYGDWFLSGLEARDLQHKSGANFFHEFYRRLESAVLLCRTVGYAGVLFLFDEVECIATHLNNIRSRLLSYEILNTLVDARRFPHSMFLFAATEDLGSRVNTDASNYSEYESSYPEGYRFAKKWHAKDLHFLRVQSVTRVDNRKLMHRIPDLHSVAYGWEPVAQVSDPFIDDYLDTAFKCGSSQREIVKWFVEMLELAQQHSHIKLAI